MKVRRATSLAWVLPGALIIMLSCVPLVFAVTDAVGIPLVCKNADNSLSYFGVGPCFASTGGGSTSSTSSTSSTTTSSGSSSNTGTSSTTSTVTITTTTTASGATSSSSSSTTAQTTSCPAGYYLVGGACQPIPTATTTTATVSCGQYCQTTTVTTTTVGAPVCSTGSSTCSFLVTSLTQFIYPGTLTITDPNIGDLITVSGQLCVTVTSQCQTVQASGTTNNAGQYLLTLPYYASSISVPYGTTSGYYSGTLSAVDTTKGNILGRASWPTQTSVTLIYSVPLSSLGSLTGYNIPWIGELVMAIAGIFIGAVFVSVGRRR